MRKLLIFLILLFSLSLKVSADAGNNVRYSRPSSSYSSSSSSQYRGGNYRSGSGGSSGLEIVIVVGLIGFYLYDKYNKKHGSYDAKSFNPTINSGQTSLVPKVFYNPMINDEIIKVDSSFNEKAFLSYAEEVYVKLQHAWTRKDWKEVRQYESESLYHTHGEQLKEYIQNKTTNVVERIGIKKSVLYEFRQDLDLEYLTVRMNVILRDYIIDDNTKNVLEGNPLEDLTLDYELVFTRKQGQKTRENHVMHALECPSCGSKNGINESGVCEYCGYQRSNDWLLNSIKTI